MVLDIFKAVEPYLSALGISVEKGIKMRLWD